MADARFVGRTYEAPPFEVTEASIRAYMRATGDLRQEPELVAPPTYAVVYGLDVYRQLWQDPELALDVAHLVHGEQSFTFNRPVRPGDRIRTTGRISGISARGDMELVTFDVGARDAQDQHVGLGRALFIIRRP